jgi:hypothetical protein
VLVVAGAASFISACKKESRGTPTIDYIRITRPTAADSLLVAAGQGQLVAIMGKNLGGAIEIWFNDQKSRLTPSYITNTSILVVVPSQIPLDITNKLKIIFDNGFELLHNFEVEISEPLLTSMDCEFVNEGDIATIRGDYFYAPITVTFAGGVQGEIMVLEDDVIQVKVPAGAQPGQVTVTTNFGVTESDFWFRDNRNHFINSDPYEGWWNSSLVVSTPGPTDPPKIAGNYIRFTKQVGVYSWSELAGGPASAMPVHSKNIPDDAILNPKDYYLKFEVNTLKPYNGNMVKINVALSAEDNGGYRWRPPFHTNGKWQTVSVSLDEVFADYATKPVVNPNGYWSRLLLGNADSPLDADMCFDNFRVVPKVSE